MADTPGVTHTPSHTPPAHAGSGGSWFKRNKKLALIGGGGVLLLLAGHKGNKASQASASDPNAALQAGADAAAQAQTDAALANDAASMAAPGGVAPTTIDTGGGSYVGAGAQSPTVVSPPNVTVDMPAPTPAATEMPDINRDPDLNLNTIKERPPHSQPPKNTKGKPAGKDGKVTHPSKGHQVQTHTGTHVHGRHFPGATGHTVGAPRRVNGNTHHDVTVHYGGHSDTHTSVNNGQQWIDNTKGKNPPSRGQTHTVRPTTTVQRSDAQAVARARAAARPPARKRSR